jgi:glucose/arabinose dehydrogenase
MKSRILLTGCFIVSSLAGLMHGQSIQLVPFITSGLNLPVGVYFAPGSDELYIVQQRGKIMIANTAGTVSSTPFLDITSLVSQSGNERGLLGMAFHPDYQNNGYFYVNYTKASNGNTVIARYQRSAGNPLVADPNSQVILMEITQPYSNHNGGQLHFGPDGYLYIGLGDGGSAGDPQNNAQNMNSYLGKMLRIDVDNGNPYAVPPTNPFVNVANTKPEIWASGLRNPWCYSFDKVTGDLWIADVGQNAWEEVNYQPASSAGGENYGWRCYEGAGHSYNTSGCGPVTAYTLPVAEYGHSGGHCSVTGGYVYRGGQFGDLYGKYLYTDYCSGAFWATYPNQSGGFTTQNLTQVNAPVTYALSAFGQDHNGELYVVGRDNNRIYKLTATSCKPAADIFTDKGYNFIMCSGDSITLQAPYGPGHTYQWFYNGFPAPGAPNAHHFTVGLPGNYQLVVFNSSGCSDTSDVITVTSIAPPNPVITNAITSFCENEGEVTLVASIPGGLWYGNGVLGQTFSPALAGVGVHTISYTVEENGCTSLAQVDFTVLAKPMATFVNLPAQVCIGETVTLQGAPPGGVFSGTGVNGNILNTSSLSEGLLELFYIYTDANGCSDTAKGSLVLIQCAGLSSTLNRSGLIVYPNPFKEGLLFIKMGAEDYTGILDLTLTDLHGTRLAAQRLAYSGVCSWSLPKMSAGLYLLEIKTDGGVFRDRLLIVP